MTGFGGFQTIAMKNVKGKDSPKDSLSDLFACVESLDAARVSLGEFSNAVAGGDKASKLETYLEAIRKIEEGLLEMAKEKVGELPEPELEEGPEQISLGGRSPVVAKR